MLVAIIALQVLDILTTFYLVRKKGMREANPLLNWAMQRIGFWPALIAFKGVFIVLLLTVPVSYIFEVVILALYLAVVANNLRLMKGLDDGSS